METKYDLTSLALNHDDYLTFGSTKAILTYVWGQYPGTDEIPLTNIIQDEDYWTELENWENNTDENEDDWSPDKWTRDWFAAHDMVDTLTKLLTPDNAG